MEILDGLLNIANIYLKQQPKKKKKGKERKDPLEVIHWYPGPGDLVLSIVNSKLSLLKEGRFCHLGLHTFCSHSNTIREVVLARDPR